MKLFDFDKTVYLKDSTVELYKFCLKKKPYLIFALPLQAWGFLMYKLGLKPKEYFKEKFLFFVKHFKSISCVIDEFWEKEEKNICVWFRDCANSDDVVVTASPEFLVKPMTDKLGVRCLGSIVSPENGKFLSPNCKGKEKVRRLEEIGITEATEAYSDSKSDLPMLMLAERGYIIKNRSVDVYDTVEYFSKENDQ